MNISAHGFNKVIGLMECILWGRKLSVFGFKLNDVNPILFACVLK